ncbi:homocysteine S-methyltransferase family protein [Desulfoplanes formicivorans]|uniref:Methionine synthase n=1 Tax=Desulfoplanes formicivorans TaxID=1592317 RepID=A0A194AGA1_9BACT|nr:homocysteine S-methyltransferase family protein [Desulfoplanes formicivorans]GAU08235.1 methionine synthase [Desulfoplanes formicivorans]
MQSFRTFLASGKTIIFDGGMGTLLQARGLAPGESPERFSLRCPNVVEQIHRDYWQAGAHVVTTNTFGGTRFKLGGDVDPVEMNRIGASLARKAVGDKGFVAGSIGPTGRMIEPLGDVTFRELVQAFEEQIRGLVQGGVDLILGETHFDLAEARAVVVAARHVCDLPVGISMTFEEGVSLTGTSPRVFLDTVENMGVDLVATNCSAGPEELLVAAKEMLAGTRTPLLVQPNAGLPELVDGKTVFRLDPEAFAVQTREFVRAGVQCVGGCCGTTPDHIRALKAETEALTPTLPEQSAHPCIVLTSRSTSLSLGFEYPSQIIGERINPTGKKDLIAQFQNGEITRALELAQEQVDMGVGALDVNVGAPMADEQELLPLLVRELASRMQTPLCIDSSDEQAVIEALNVYPGSPLVNSISGEPGKMERLGPLCRDYGAPFILLPLKKSKLPVTAAERIAIIDELVDQADSLSIPRRLILVDALALTVSSKPLAARACLDVIRYCREALGLTTVMGLSNISFGLPARELLNTHFMTMCMAAGMGAFIANPNSQRLQEALAASEVLLGRDPQAASFIDRFSDWQPKGGTLSPARKADGDVEDVGRSSIERAVIKGEKDAIEAMVLDAIKDGADPFEVVNAQLIPGITAVGEKYERREYFLPQLLRSAETMQKGFNVLQPYLEKDGGSNRIRIVMATVEGDIHDIGKNIVCLMLRNHGFEVIDLGKDVPAKTIVRAVEESGARIVGLSALMTTTMVRMQDTVDLLREKGLPCKVMVGGAVVSQAFAERIGADGYSEDAVAAVRLAQRLCGAASKA